MHSEHSLGDEKPKKPSKHLFKHHDKARPLVNLTQVTIDHVENVELLRSEQEKTESDL